MAFLSGDVFLDGPNARDMNGEIIVLNEI